MLSLPARRTIAQTVSARLPVFPFLEEVYDATLPRRARRRRALTPFAAPAQTPDDPIAYAQSAAPASISADATIVDAEGNLLREGTNEWTCVAMPEAPMCLDQQWMSWLDAYINQTDEVPVTALGTAYMLQGDVGASNIDRYAAEPTPENEWVVTGPHLMLIVPDPALLEGIPSDPPRAAPT